MKHRYDGCLDPQPFREWCNERIDEGRPSDALGGYARHCGSEKLAARLGLDPRRLYAWRFENQHLDRLDLEEALERADCWISDLYPEFAAETETTITGYCPGCKDDVPADSERRCLWCETKVWKRRSGIEPGQQSFLSDSQLRALHRLHQQGAPIRELGRRTWRAAGYASEGAAWKAIERGFRRLHLAAVRRQVAPDHFRCNGIKNRHPRKGERCPEFAMAGSTFCWAHDPARRAEVIEQMDAARARVGAAA